MLELTEIMALQDAIAIVNGGTPTIGNHEEVAYKLQCMLDTRLRRKNAPRTPSKEQLANERLMRQVAAKVAAHGEPVNTQWLLENSTMASPQKATAIMRKAIEAGLIEKRRDGMGKVCYVATAA